MIQGHYRAECLRQVPQHPTRAGNVQRSAALAGDVVFFGDLGGSFYALDAANGEKLWGQDLGGAIGGGVITYTANGAQKVAVATGFTHLAWPTKIVKAKVAILGVDSASANQ